MFTVTFVFPLNPAGGAFGQYRVFGVVPHLGGTSVLREFYVGWVTRAHSFEHVTGRLLSLTLFHRVILARRGRTNHSDEGSPVTAGRCKTQRAGQRFHSRSNGIFFAKKGEKPLDRSAPFIKQGESCLSLAELQGWPPRSAAPMREVPRPCCDRRRQQWASSPRRA